MHAQQVQFRPNLVSPFPSTVPSQNDFGTKEEAPQCGQIHQQRSRELSPPGSHPASVAPGGCSPGDGERARGGSFARDIIFAESADSLPVKVIVEEGGGSLLASGKDAKVAPSDVKDDMGLGGEEEAGRKQRGALHNAIRKTKDFFLGRTGAEFISNSRRQFVERQQKRLEYLRKHGVGEASYGSPGAQFLNGERVGSQSVI